ncbi:MAG TPA: GAF and ANTAR domain-containing protein [Actinospica sp.]|jgi:hypothetical protein|nr:GAF and ANTAR domain-containing protein [Actinospica sp.]
MDSTRLYDLLNDGADTARPEYDPGEHLGAFAADCARVLDKPGVTILLLGERGRLEYGAAWGESGDRLLALEIETGEGPSVHCAATGAGVRCMDVAPRGGRWVEWASTGLRAGYGSCQSVPLRTPGEQYGALTVYARESGFPDPAAARLAAVLAEGLAAGLGFQQRRREHADEIAQLQRGIASRVLIEQAKGMLAERYRCGLDEAFEMLRSVARGHGMRLHELARAVVQRDVALGLNLLPRERPGG